MWRFVLLLAVGCNEIYGLDKTDPLVVPDAPPPPDEDNDGFADADDNCPSLANPDQSEADGDGRGDRCDECPLIPSAPSADFDGDKLGDLCDPSPRAPGDCLLLVDNFTDPAAFDTGWTLLDDTAP